MIFWPIFFPIFTYIFGHRDLDLWPKVTNFNRVRASVVSSHLAKTASKSVHPFGWNFVHKNPGHSHTQTDTQTNCSENITPPRFRGGVKKSSKLITRLHCLVQIDLSQYCIFKSVSSMTSHYTTNPPLRDSNRLWRILKWPDSVIIHLFNCYLCFWFNEEYFFVIL